MTELLTSDGLAGATVAQPGGSLTQGYGISKWRSRKSDGLFQYRWEIALVQIVNFRVF